MNDAELILQRKHAKVEGWLSEIEGIDRSLNYLGDERAEAHRIQQREPIYLDLPAIGCCGS